MSLLEAYNMPFAAALVLLVFIAIAQLIGAGDLFDGGDIDIDLDVDLDADGAVSGGGGFVEAAFSLLGIGRVPMLIWFAMFLLVFAAIGASGQSLAISLLGSPLDPFLAAVLAFVGALPVNAALTRPLERLLPQDETSAVPLDSLVRREAVIQIGTARAGSPARSKVIDVHGHPHFVMVEPNDADSALGEGETVLLVRREGEVFYAVQYENPLLGLE